MHFTLKRDFDVHDVLIGPN